MLVVWPGTAGEQGGEAGQVVPAGVVQDGGAEQEQVFVAGLAGLG